MFCPSAFFPREINDFLDTCMDEAGNIQRLGFGDRHAFSEVNNADRDRFVVLIAKHLAKLVSFSRII